jgi:hypothetical protein
MVPRREDTRLLPSAPSEEGEEDRGRGELRGDCPSWSGNMNMPQETFPRSCLNRSEMMREHRTVTPRGSAWRSCGDTTSIIPRQSPIVFPECLSRNAE